MKKQPIKNLQVEHYCKVKARIVKISTETYKECPFGCGWTLQNHTENIQKEENQKILELGKKILAPENAEVYYRKLQLVGGSTFNVSIPHAFIERLKLNPADIAKVTLIGKKVMVQFYEED